MKVNIKKHTMMYPAPAVVASAYDSEGNADACTLAFATMCSHHPPAVMIAINSTLKRKTLKSILQTNEFCLAFPSADQVAEADYIGIESGYNADKLAKINYHHHKAVLDEKNRIVFEKLNPLVYDDITHSYFKTGEKISDAFKVGLKFKKE